MNKVAIVPETEVMYKINNMNCHSPRLTCLWLPLNIKSNSIRNQHWATNIAPFFRWPFINTINYFHNRKISALSLLEYLVWMWICFAEHIVSLKITIHELKRCFLYSPPQQCWIWNQHHSQRSKLDWLWNWLVCLCPLPSGNTWLDRPVEWHFMVASCANNYMFVFQKSGAEFSRDIFS